MKFLISSGEQSVWQMDRYKEYYYLNFAEKQRIYAIFNFGITPPIYFLSLKLETHFGLKIRDKLKGH